jgi:UDP-N-acetylmuramoyl-tripeptide--D-alanyl-D-alanine ligase
MRDIIAKVLRWQAKKYLNKNNITVVAITGSVGKTSTTQAVATVLSKRFTVRKTLENYNTDIGIPCSIFNHKIPSNLRNPFSWSLLFIKNQISIYKKAPFEIVVLELGTDKPGDIISYNWLNIDISIVTAVAPEHMEFFTSLENVAKEELSVGSFSEKVLINKNMVDSQYLKYINNDQIFNYTRDDINRINLNKEDLNLAGDHSLDAVAAAISVGKVLGMNESELILGAKSITALPGRMQILKGIKNSKIIDDTYNSSPEAVLAALDYIYSVKSPQRIALLGNMNELGQASKDLHIKIGEYCDPKKLDLVVTLGEDANRYLADAAKNKGCAVAEAISPYEAGEIIKRQMKNNSVVLCKGSQNGVFAEEAVKILLENKDDEKYLVRQSKFWQKKKLSSFKYNQ